MLASATSSRQAQLPLALLAYAIALALLLLVPPLLKGTVGPPAAFTTQEALDLLTPVVIIPIAWWAFDLAGGLGRAGLAAFLVLAAVWIEGQGIHLAANGIGDAYDLGGPRDAFYAAKGGALAEWLDEVLSHWMWHGAWVGISMLLMATTVVRQGIAWAGPGATAIAAGLVHGATFFIVTVEGATTQLGIPASVVLLAWAVAAIVLRGRHPIATFFVASSALTLLGYLAWAALHAWTLPEFCGTLLAC